MQVAKYYSQLIKFRLSTTVVFSATAGYLLGTTQVNIQELFLLIIGGFLVTGSANGFNQVLEQDHDKLMSRTANRPLPKKNITTTRAILFSALIPYPFGFIKTIGFIFYFGIYIFLLSNIFITIAILSDKLSTILISVFAFIFFLLFGSGLIISPSFYPSSLESLLSVLPLAMVIKAMQSYLFSGFINWTFTVIPFLTCLLLLSLNSSLIRNKLRQ